MHLGILMPSLLRTKNIVVPRFDNGEILIWQNNATGTPTTTIPAGPSNPWGVFVTSGEQIFVDTGPMKGQADRWTLNGTRLSSMFFLCSRCFGLFVVVNNYLYCSAHDLHQVVRQCLSDPSSELTIVAGTSSERSTDEMLKGPFRIFVTFDLDLYVADYYNDRVQLFRSGQRNGSLASIDLNGPTWVFVDGDGYLFIVGSGPKGFRCL